MRENAVIQRKLEVFDITLTKLREYLPVTYQKLCEDWGLQKYEIITKRLTDFERFKHEILANKTF